VPNQPRKRSDYLLALTEEQFERFEEIANSRQQSVEQVLLDALDEFIQHEKENTP
jgi:hypothetical protein